MTLKSGSRGPEVTKLQERLKAHGFNPGAIDGEFSAGTEAAVIAFQRSESLLADGVAGPRTAAALELSSPPEPPSVIPGITVAVVSRMFPETRIDSIKESLPVLCTSLQGCSLTEKPMVLMALASIRAETECFQPIDEGQSKFNTSPGGHPFDLYDNRKDLGNQGPPDGERFKGRGFIQLTGRANYAKFGPKIGVDLIAQPELANDPKIAADLLALFLKEKEIQIKQAIIEGDLKHARRLVNGGSHGLDRFSDAFRIGNELIPDQISSATA